MEKYPLISVIIPTLDNPESVKKIILTLNRQTLLPAEIVISDSSSGKGVENSTKEIDSKIAISYLRVGKIYPYEASNLGAHHAKYKWLAFLDTTTIPDSSWLKDYYKIIEQKKMDVIFGVTKYLAQTNFQHLIRASTYGRKGHETAPGTLIRKKDFINSGEIIEGVRSGGDIEWRNRIKSSFNWTTPEDISLTYSSLPTNLLTATRKFFIYQLHGARLDIQNTIKDIYLGLLLILSAIIIPKWNSFVGWEASSLYMPNVTKIYLISLVIIFFTTLVVNKAFLKRFSNSFSSNVLKTLIFVFLFISVFRWNDVIAGWVEASVWYVPHITKIFVVLVLFSSLVYRGLYFPLTNEVKKEYLFPFKWVTVGMLGLYLDCVKAPGYVIGSILSPFTNFKIKKTN